MRIALLLLLVWPSLAPAAIDDDWQAGKSAFAAGRYAAALDHFERARDQGLDSPAVHYNIGVAQYRLERYADAQATFELIAERFPQMRGLAEYNLGLIAARLGDDDTARDRFRNAYELGDDPTVRRLAAERIGRSAPDTPASSRWSGVIGVRGGNDDNIALRDETGLPLGTTTESPFADVFASFSGPWSRDGGFMAEGSAYVVRYLDADEFNQAQLAGGAFYDWRPDKWRLRLGVRAAFLTLAGDGYDRKVGVHARAIRYVGANAALDVRYSHDDVTEQDPRYIGVDGTRWQLDLRYRWYRDGHRWQLRYMREANDRLDPALSPKRNQLAVDYSFRPRTGFGFTAGVELRNSDYGELTTPRKEDLVSLRGGASYSLGDSWILLLDVERMDNDSTDEVYSYDRTRISIGAMRLF